MSCAVRWQVFGLAGVATGRLLAIASQADQAAPARKET
jgi:hypothetical protein